MLQLILSGGMINAQEAYRIGLVNEVVPVADLIPRAEAILNQIFKNAPVAIKYSLEAVNKGLETSMNEGLSLEASLFGICASTEDKKEVHKRSFRSVMRILRGSNIFWLKMQ